MERKPIRDIAAAVVQRDDGKILLLKRAPTHHPGGGQWCFVTGYVEQGEKPGDAAARELHEELGVEAGPVREGPIVVVELEKMTLHVHPFLFTVPDFPVRLDWEHTESAWIEAGELYGYDFVQQLDEDLYALGLLP
jgi:8-oxo-dGTP pyrophosphatase MutT (NUDIX family)